MTRVLLIAMLALLPVVGRSAEPGKVWACPMEDSAPALKPGRCPVCGMKRVLRPEKPGDGARMRAAAAAVKPAPAAKPAAAPAAAQRYHCPMHPQIVRDHPGECPICFMRLVAFTPEDVRIPIRERAVVTLDAARRRQLGVVTATVRSRTLSRTIRLPGRVAHDPDLYAALTEYQAAVESAGRSRTPSGGPLADVLEAAEIKLAHYGVSEAQARELAAAGHVRHLMLPGDQVWIHASAFEQDLPWIHPGQRASIEVTALPGRRLTGIVEAIEPSLDPVSRTATVRLLAENPAGASMRLEMYATVRIEAGTGAGLVVPRDAVLDTGERRIVFVVRGDELEPREVDTGVRMDDGIEIRRGLAAGETVVASGNFLIDADSQIRAAIAAQTGGAISATSPTGSGAAGGHAH